MTRFKLLTISAAAILAIGVPCAALARPNYSGTWKLNAAKSDLGPLPAPDKFERKVSHEDPNLKFSTTQTSPERGEMTSEMTYTTDGKPSTNKTAFGEVTGTAQWEGDVLTIKTKREVQGAEITQNERWNLSEDGKTLTITNQVTTPQGDFEIKLVLDKQ